MQLPYTFRHPTLDDLSSVFQVQYAFRIYDFGSSSLTEDDLRTSWQSGKVDLDSDAWLAVDPKGQVVACAELLPDSADTWVAINVLPNCRDHGIESHLISLAESRARERHTATSAEPAILFGRVFDANKPAQRAFEHAGYDLNLSFQIMQIDLNLTQPLSEPNFPPGITVRTFVPGQDDQATYAADEELGEDKGYHSPLTFDRWANRMGLNKPDFDPTLWFLANDGPDIAGVCLNYYHSATNTSATNTAATNTARVDHLGVRRPWRKCGLGTALLLHSFHKFHAHGIPTAQLSVDSANLTKAPRVYAQAGMRIVQLYHIYRKTLSAQSFANS